MKIEYAPIGKVRSPFRQLDVDLLGGTPTLDIKPYVRQFDERTETRSGWLEKARKRDKRSDKRFE